MENEKEVLMHESKMKKDYHQISKNLLKNKKMKLVLILVSGLSVLSILILITAKILSVQQRMNGNHIASNHLQPYLNKPEDITARVNRLQKGVSISRWFRFPADESDTYYLHYISDDDLNVIEQSGFTHVRLCISPKYIFDTSSQTKINTHMLPFIDKAIAKILDHHLSVVVDIHDENKTYENDANAKDFIIFWSNFARHLTQFDTSNVYFELLNEPVFDGKEDIWLTLQKKLITSVRAQAPQNTIIATGANWGGIEGLQKVKPFEDKNIIYSFHYYEPSAFTHQGADWAGNDYPSIANLEYPYNATNCEQVLSNVKTDGAKELVQEYCDMKWNKESINHFIQQAEDWSKENNVRSWVGEFGVYCKQSPKQSKLQWIKDVKDILEQKHIGWTLWAYDDCFGLGVTKANGTIMPDSEVLQTLGLKERINSPTVTDNTGNSQAWKDLIGSSWQWQLSEPIDQSVNAKIYDIDYEKNDIPVVKSLHAKEIKVICYISVGAWENWRNDANQFPQSVIGKDYTNWPGEKWLDIRQISLIGPILQKRLDMCQKKGFDAIEPDNIHGYQEDTGFSLTYHDQLTFNRWLAQEAHKRGLLIGLKNDSEQVNDLLPFFDFAVTEDCFSQGWCNDMSPFIMADKPVFAAEYTDTGMTPDKFCPQAKQLQFSGILKTRNLDSFIRSCN